MWTRRAYCNLNSCNSYAATCSGTPYQGKFSIFLLNPFTSLKTCILQSQYVYNKKIKATLGAKIVAPDLEKAIAGSRLLIIGPDDIEAELREEVTKDLTTLNG